MLWLWLWLRFRLASNNSRLCLLSLTPKITWLCLLSVTQKVEAKKLGAASVVAAVLLVCCKGYCWIWFAVLYLSWIACWWCWGSCTNSLWIASFGCLDEGFRYWGWFGNRLWWFKVDWFRIIYCLWVRRVCCSYCSCCVVFLRKKKLNLKQKKNVLHSSPIVLFSIFSHTFHQLDFPYLYQLSWRECCGDCSCDRGRFCFSLWLFLMKPQKIEIWDNGLEGKQVIQHNGRRRWSPKLEFMLSRSKCIRNLGRNGVAEKWSEGGKILRRWAQGYNGLFITHLTNQ